MLAYGPQDMTVHALYRSLPHARLLLCCCVEELMH
jgi:hypothetical protein